MEFLTNVSLPADPAAASHATRMAWADAENGWGLGDYIAAGAAIKAWTGNPGYSTTSALVSGRIQLNKLWLRTPATLSTLHVTLTTAGTSLTSGQNFAAIFDGSGNQVAVSADQTTAFGSTGLKSVAMTTPYAATAGGYYAAVLFVGTGTAPVLLCHGATGTSMLNFGLTAATARALQTSATTYTSIPTSLTLSSQTTAAMNYMTILT